MTKQDFADQILSRERTLYRVARAMLKNPADQQDAVSEAVAKAWQKLPTLREEKYFATWLTRILINECTTILRRQKRITLMADWKEDAIQQKAGFDEPSQVNAALDALPDKLRLTVTLHYLEGFSLEDIAQMQRLPIGTVKSRLHEGRKALKLELSKDEEA